MYWYNDIGFRPIERRDLENIRNLRNDPSTWIYLTDVTQITPSMQEKWFESIEKATNKAYFAVFTQTKDFPIIHEGNFIGIIRCDQMDHINRSIRVGADVAREKRGKGYGTKILKAVLEYFFEQANFHRIWLCVLEGNHIAHQLYENVGFREEGRLRKAIWRNGEWVDYIVMSILDEEYRK